MAKTSGFRAFWLFVVTVCGLVVCFLVYVPRITGYEVARTRSPDAWNYAVLMEIPRDAAGAHSYKVCMQRASTQVTLATCDEIAYLGGVTTINASHPVSLVWTTSSQLEIRYTNAAAVHIYKPVYVSGSRRRPALHPPIFITAVRSDSGSNDIPASAH